MRFSEMKQKEVVNICDGRKLGCVVDLEIDCECGEIRAVIAPAPFSFSAVFRGEHTGIVIPWRAVVKIGDDAILVRMEELWTVEGRG